MEQAPQPIAADRLRAMLSGAKAVMQKVETGDFTPGSINQNAFAVDGTQLIEAHSPQMANQMVHHTSQHMQHDVTHGNFRNMNTSRMPAAIKEAMINNPIGEPNGLTHTFNLEDVSDLVEKPMPYGYTPPRPRPVQENYHQQPPAPQYQPQYQPQPQAYQPPQGSFMVNESQLKGMISEMMKDYMLEFMSTTFTKNLSEEVIKKTLQTLVKEGKIAVKAKQPVKS